MTSEDGDRMLAADLAAVAERLRRATVLVRGPGRWASGGAGVVWRPGLIVTNAHVAGKRKNVVEAADGAAQEAELVAFDPRRDLALLRVDATHLPVADIAPQGTLRVGALVLAVGNPLGSRGAVTTGIVHALSQQRRRARVILADVRLLPGNSGGPLGDAAGRVVGLNTMILRGLAAAIPSEVVERFVRAARPAA
jgi:serine protease Do